MPYGYQKSEISDRRCVKWTVDIVEARLKLPMLVSSVPRLQNSLNTANYSFVSDVDSVPTIMPVKKISIGDYCDYDERLAFKVGSGIVESLNCLDHSFPSLYEKFVAVQMSSCSWINLRPSREEGLKITLTRGGYTLVFGLIADFRNTSVIDAPRGPCEVC